MGHTDRMNTSFPGHEGVSGEITAKYLIFAAVSDLAISGAHRDGFYECMCPSLQVGVDRRRTTLPCDHRRLVIRKKSGRHVVWYHSDGMLVEWEGKIVGRSACGLDSRVRHPLLINTSIFRRFVQILRKEQPSGEHTCAKFWGSMTRRCFFRNFPPVLLVHHILER